MRRWMLMVCGLLLISWLSPGEGTDVGELQPVELVQIVREGQSVRISTDTGDFGMGNTLKAALENLKATTAGTIFLDTADYLLLTQETEELTGEIAQVLRPGVEVCLVQGLVEEQEAAKFLAAHSPGAPLRKIQYGQLRPPMLNYEKGRLKLVE